MKVATPALLIAAPGSGHGKTAITAALARLHRRLGRRVRIIKCGPDFLDPMTHAVASGAPCYHIDLGMCGEADGRRRLFDAARNADIVLIEGAMGLYDGTPSAADIARCFNLPVMAVIDARGMAQTFGALALGLATYQPGLNFSGVLANRVGSARHVQLLRASLPSHLRWYGGLPRNDASALPERHLGLLQAEEIPDLTERLDQLADQLAATGAGELPPVVEFVEFAAPPGDATPTLLAGRRIAIARDAAFGFIYPANLDTLIELGAELQFFSPLAGDALPDCDAVWLPGGYPELHAQCLSARRDLWLALAAHVAEDKPLLAECGGMMALFETLTGKDGQNHSLAGLLPGHVTMQPRLAALGMQVAELPEGTLRGHTFHYSSAETPLSALAHATTPDGRPGEAIYRIRRLTASYVHYYFPSNPEAVARLLA